MAKAQTAFCPVCRSRAENTVCPQCKTDLGEYLSVYYAPDMLWNIAAAAFAEHKYSEAFDRLAEAHYLRPSDAAILRQMAVCAENYGSIERAYRCIEKAKEISDDKEIAAHYDRLYQKIVKLVEKADKTAAKPTASKPQSTAHTSKKKKKKHK